MFNGFLGRQRVAPLAERRVAMRLREALAALPAPWVVLVNRRSSGADGPPWVRFLALHPEKGIALVDTDSPDAAVAPLEDFLARTGFPALRAGALPIVPVGVGAGEVGVIADILDAAFAPVQGQIGNPNWSEAVVELLLTAPDLMLAQLRRMPVATGRPVQAEAPVRQPVQPRRARPEPPRANAEPPVRAAARRGEPSLSSTPQPPQPVPSGPQSQPVQPEIPRLVPRQVASERPARRPPDSLEDARLVPRRVAAAAPPSRAARPATPPREPPAFGDDLEIPQSTSRHAPTEPERAAPQFGGRDEPQFSLKAEEPVIPLGLTGAGRRRREPTFRAGALRPDSGLTDRQPRRRRRPYAAAAAAAVLLVAVGAIAVWYREAPPTETASNATPPSTPAPSVSVPPPLAPVQTAKAPTPKAVPAPHATAEDLPRAVLQPKIAETPPLPPPLPAEKLTPSPVRTAAMPTPKVATPKPAAKTAAVKPAPAPSASNANNELPAPIEAVLHPKAAAQQSAPPANSAVTTVTPSTPPVSVTPAPTATASAVPTATGSAGPPSGGTVTVNGVTYVNGEQPHSLGSLNNGLPGATPPSALASNGPAATAPPAASLPTALPPAASPHEVVISRAPAAAAPSVSAPTASSATGAAAGVPREVVISRAPGSAAPAPSADAPPPGGANAVPSNETPPHATGSPQSIQAVPLSGSSP